MSERIDKIIAAAKEVTSNADTAKKFLKDAGIMDENGELAEPYRNKNTMTKEELLEKLEAMRKEAFDTWYEIYMEHSGEWNSTHPDEPWRYREKTLAEVIKLVKQLN